MNRHELSCFHVFLCFMCYEKPYLKLANVLRDSELQTSWKHFIHVLKGIPWARKLPWAGRSTTTFGRNIDRTEWNTEPTEPIFGRTDLRKGVSEAKFDVEADFDVKKSLAPPKAAENHEKPKKNRKKNSKKNFRRQKIESCKSSETRFPEVSRRSEQAFVYFFSAMALQET